MKPYYDVLIVGSGHAGAQTAAALRQLKFDGSVGLLGEEQDPPYERPPLSKDYLSGDKGFERILIRPVQFWVEREIDLLPGRRVDAVHPAEHCVILFGGAEIRYGKLVWAGGGSPRRLGCLGDDLNGVHYVRTRADVDGIMSNLPKTKNVVVVGGGYIGLEAAAVMIKLGKAVTLLEALDRVLARVAAEPLSRFYEAEHRAHGVDLRLSAKVECIEGELGDVDGVRLVDGSLVAADMVIVGIGIVPSVEPLVAAGAQGRNGVMVDAFCRTSLPDIFAIGDCALHSSEFADASYVRLESVQNANDMAQTVAKAITGDERPYNSVPWFWSNQYDLRLQTVGLSLGHEEALVRGDTASRSFSIVYLKGKKVIAVDCVNNAKDYVQGRALVSGRVAAPPDMLADASVPLKELL